MSRYMNRKLKKRGRELDMFLAEKRQRTLSPNQPLSRPSEETSVDPVGIQRIQPLEQEDSDFGGTIVEA